MWHQVQVFENGRWVTLFQKRLKTADAIRKMEAVANGREARVRTGPACLEVVAKLKAIGKSA